MRLREYNLLQHYKWSTQLAWLHQHKTARKISPTHKHIEYRIFPCIAVHSSLLAERRSIGKKVDDLLDFNFIKFFAYNFVCLRGFKLLVDHTKINQMLNFTLIKWVKMNRFYSIKYYWWSIMHRYSPHNVIQSIFKFWEKTTKETKKYAWGTCVLITPSNLLPIIWWIFINIQNLINAVRKRKRGKGRSTME